MVSNVFEGSRRVAKIIVGIWAISWICTFFGYAYWVYKHECSIITPSSELAGDSFISCLLEEADLFTSFFIMIGFILFIWGFTWAIGYISRGYMGISRGQDKK